MSNYEFLEIEPQCFNQIMCEFIIILHTFYNIEEKYEESLLLKSGSSVIL